MIFEENYDTISALLNTASALGIIASMQIIALDVGFSSLPKIIRGIQRLILWSLALMLLYNAGWTLNSGIPPRAIDMVTFAFIFVAVAYSMVRHKMAAKRIDDLDGTTAKADDIKRDTAIAAQAAADDKVLAARYLSEQPNGRVAHH